MLDRDAIRTRLQLADLDPARQLGVDRNTVIHRMAQVETLTGRHPRRCQDVAELWLAISASEMLSSGQTANVGELRGELAPAFRQSAAQDRTQD